MPQPLNTLQEIYEIPDRNSWIPPGDPGYYDREFVRKRALAPTDIMDRMYRLDDPVMLAHADPIPKVSAQGRPLTSFLRGNPADWLAPTQSPETQLEFDFRDLVRDQHSKRTYDWAYEILQGGPAAEKPATIIAKGVKYAHAYPIEISIDHTTLRTKIRLAYASSQDMNGILRMQQQIRSNLLIKVRSRHDPLRQNCSPQEMQARLLLRDLLSEREWRGYCTNGFIMVRGASGKWYQVFQNQRRTQVYENGKLTHELCIHTHQSCPPTDHLINLKTLIETDEPVIWKLANVTPYKPLTSAEASALWDTFIRSGADVPVRRRA